jgi:hypothetical protein
MKWVDGRLKHNATADEIEAILRVGCDELFSYWPELDKLCVNFVASHKDFFAFNLREELDVAHVCDGLQFCVPNPTAPRGVHVAFGGAASRMAVSWLTYSPTNTSAVQWSLSPNGTVLGTAHGVQTTYLISAGYNHHVVITGLKPDTRYYYRCGDAQGGWSEVHSFVSATDQPRPFSIAVYGDMGVHNSRNTIARVKDLVNSSAIDWVLHVGDISYADDYAGNIYEYVWDRWFQRMDPLPASVPYMVGPGNHEFSCMHPLCAVYSANFTAYNHRFRMPGPESGSNTSMFYSFDYSLAHFISLSSETDYPYAPYASQFGNQLAWLERDLKQAASARSASRPWIIVFAHRPIYTSNAEYFDQPVGYAKYLQDSFEDLLHKYGVDLYIGAHEHSYERGYAIYRGQIVSKDYVNAGAPAYVVAGAAGCLEGLDPWPSARMPGWTATRYNDDMGYATLDIQPTTMTWTYRSSRDGVVRDRFTITKTRA